jgi:hypothetical protein
MSKSELENFMKNIDHEEAHMTNETLEKSKPRYGWDREKDNLKQTKIYLSSSHRNKLLTLSEFSGKNYSKTIEACIDKEIDRILKTRESSQLQKISIKVHQKKNK